MMGLERESVVTLSPQNTLVCFAVSVVPSSLYPHVKKRCCSNSGALCAEQNIMGCPDTACLNVICSFARAHNG